MIKRIGLIIADFLLLTVASFIASWAVFGSTPHYLLDTISRLNILGTIFILIAVRFYRIRISESSLDVLSRGLTAFVPSYVLSS